MNVCLFVFYDLRNRLTEFDETFCTRFVEAPAKFMATC